MSEYSEENRFLYDDTAFMYYIITLGGMLIIYLIVPTIKQIINPLENKPWLKSSLKHDFYR